VYQICRFWRFTVPVLSPPRCLTLSGPAGPPGRPWLRWVHIRSGTSLLGAVRTLTRPQVVFRGPGPPCHIRLSGLHLDRQVPLQSGRVYRPPRDPQFGGPGRGYTGPPGPPIWGVLGGGILGVPGPPWETPREGVPGPPWAGVPPGGRPGARGPGGVHFRGYLITLPVGTDVGIRNRKGWFSGGQKSPPGRPGAQNRPPGPPPGPPRGPPPGGPPGRGSRRAQKGGIFDPSRTPQNRPIFGVLRTPLGYPQTGAFSGPWRTLRVPPICIPPEA